MGDGLLKESLHRDLLNREESLSPKLKLEVSGITSIKEKLIEELADIWIENCSTWQENLYYPLEVLREMVVFDIQKQAQKEEITKEINQELLKRNFKGVLLEETRKSVECETCFNWRECQRVNI